MGSNAARFTIMTRSVVKASANRLIKSISLEKTQHPASDPSLEKKYGTQPLVPSMKMLGSHPFSFYSAELCMLSFLGHSAADIFQGVMFPVKIFVDNQGLCTTTVDLREWLYTCGLLNCFKYGPFVGPFVFHFAGYKATEK